MRGYRLNWRRMTAIAAMIALALNIVVGAFCDCKAETADHCTPAISTHVNVHQTSNKGHSHGQQDDNDLCCKCCGTIALNSTNAPPLLSLSVRIEWHNGLLFFVADHVLPKPPRHFSEPPRGPPLDA
jgi:Protein of unknown function (DUF2946)